MARCGTRARALQRIGLLLAAVVAAACSRTNGLGDLKYYPGASRVGETSFAGEMFGFPAASWEQVELRSEAPFEHIRDFYAGARIAGWTSTFESEASKRPGRVYTRYLADTKRRTFYVITVEERRRTRDVSVLLRRGLAMPPRR